MTPKKPSDDNQPDLFGNGGTAVVEKDEKPAATHKPFAGLDDLVKGKRKN